ncbi:YpoC family protein [Massilibacterium senegalense]|uniref:YpoC family protein n=1 Tax=Massilibacterium senegalense TaxID=1632858 RepID=UPI000780EF37|nr:hypothetical protein [Massilibacterium senegalense]
MKEMHSLASLRNSPFDQWGTKIKMDDTAQWDTILLLAPFMLDQLDGIAPWENPNAYLPTVFLSAQQKLQQAKECFQQRKKTEASKPLLFSLALFLDALFWMNHRRFVSLDDLSVIISSFQWKPINVVERVNFILQKPTLFHSSIQLEQLLDELIKVNVKRKIKAGE